jgi:hypothetical protein
MNGYTSTSRGANYMNDAFVESSSGCLAVHGFTRNAMSIGWKVSKKLVLPVIMLLLCLTGNSISATNADLEKAIDDLTVKLSSANSELDKLSQTQARLLDTFKLTNAGKASLLVIGVSTGTPGANMTLPISHINGPSPVVAIQFDLVIPASFTVVNVTAGPALVAADKQVAFNMVNGKLRVIAWGMNENAIGTGVVVNIVLKSLPATPKWAFTTWFTETIVIDKATNWVLHLPTVGAVILR